jgi:sulfate adenylyltransferase
LHHNRLENQQLWPIPITLDVNEEFAEKIKIGHEISLCDPDNTMLARMKVTDKWKANKSYEAEAVFGTNDTKHPGVNYLFNRAGAWYLGGSVQLLQKPKHYDFAELRHTPKLLKQHFLQLQCENIVGFQTRNPIHRAHMELTLRAAKENDAHILLHPVVGLTKPGDIDYFTRVRCYQQILRHYPSQKATLSLLPLAMRMGGPREALWHALIRKNYGCTHFIIGRDHAGPGNDSHGKAFYDPYAAQETVKQYQDEIGIKIVTFQEMVYVKERKQYLPTNELQPQDTVHAISGTELRQALLTERAIPEWFSFPEIMNELSQSYPPKHKQGFTLFFTGLSGSGKTTLAQALMAKLMSEGKRNISLLDGDVIRRILTSELGFSKSDRDLNIKRIGFVASEITKAGGIALCAAIAPYSGARMENRQLISQYGGYIEVYISTPLKECEKRDTKGLYAKAKSGKIKGLTGVDDPYEPPDSAEIVIDTSRVTIEEAINKIMDCLQNMGYLKLSMLAPIFSLSSITGHG